MKTNGKRVVTLVHGTWGRGIVFRHTEAEWTRRNSSFRDRFEAHIGPETTIEVFNWSGMNTIRARSKAANRLREHVRSVANRYPGAVQFIIAHSHGGNIAMYALRDPQVRGLVRGTICLSTPFLHARYRNLGSFAPRSMVVLGVAVFLAIMWYLDARYFSDWNKAAAVYPVIICTLLLLLPLLLIGAWWTGLAAKLRDELAFPNLAQSELLVIRAAGDEASGILVSAHFLSFVFSKVWVIFTRGTDRLHRTLLRLSSWLQRLPKLGRFCVGIIIASSLTTGGILTCRFLNQPLKMPLIVVIGVIGILLIVELMQQLAHENLNAYLREKLRGVQHSYRSCRWEWHSLSTRTLLWISSCGAVSIIYYAFWLFREPDVFGILSALVPVMLVATVASFGAAVMVLTILGALLLLCMIIPMAVFLLPFGPKLALASLLLEVSAEGTPPGRYLVHQLSDLNLPTFEVQTDVPGLMHTSYDDPRTAEVIGSWIRQRSEGK